jgi:hypothetical protein
MATTLQVWTAEDAKRFLEALADDRLVGVWTLALHTGMRRGASASARWSTRWASLTEFVASGLPSCRPEQGAVPFLDGEPRELTDTCRS